MAEPTPIHNLEVHVPAPEVGEVGVEHHVERQPGAAERQPELQPVDHITPPSIAPASVAIDQPATPRVKQVEDIMADGLQDAYQAMDPATQQHFKEVGETTAATIARMLEQSKVQVKKIVQLILAWLKIIPRSNPFYLEQEAKIKSDQLVAMAHQENKLPPTP